MTKIRLNKFLSESGICSRREADEHILRGKVKINDIDAKLGDKVNPEKDVVTFNENIVRITPNNFVYYALYKPKGIISTSSDEQGRKSVIDLVPKEPRVYPVGRLDKESEGLIILTNDGELANELMHPSFEHKKKYEIVVRNRKNDKGKLKSAAIKDLFEKGMQIDGTLMKMDSVQINELDSESRIITAVLHTGYNRQIRKMCDKIGLEAVRLKRIGIGGLTLASLKIKPGEYKKIERKLLISN